VIASDQVKVSSSYTLDPDEASIFLPLARVPRLVLVARRGMPHLYAQGSRAVIGMVAEN
jgi:hypothetical protein